MSLWLWAAAGAALSAFAQERVGERDLPRGVQQTLERWRAEGPVKQVTRQTEDGKTIYLVEIEKNNAVNPRLRIAEDGTILPNPTPSLNATGDGLPILSDEYGTPLMAARLTLADLPEAVQQTASTESRGREIADIDRETWRGQRVYEIEFKERGLNSRVYVDDNGKVVRNEHKPGEAVRALFMGTQLSDTPPAVQDTIRRIAGDREIADIDQKTTGGQSFYRVEIRSPQGTQEVRVAADGKVLYDSRSAPPRRG